MLEAAASSLRRMARIGYLYTENEPPTVILDPSSFASALSLYWPMELGPVSDTQDARA